MEKRTRQSIGILAALAAYYLVHGAHICCMPCLPACLSKLDLWNLAFKSMSAPNT